MNSQVMTKSFKIITFATEIFNPSANELKESLKKIGYELIILNENDLSNEFKKENKNLLLKKRGYGYWIWKPHLILKELIELNDNEILIYVDSTDVLTNNFFVYANNFFEKNNYLLVNRGYKHDEWTKRDCFILMNCDDENYHNKIQLEAGLIGFKKTSFNINLIKEWLFFCKNEQIITDLENKCGYENFLNFKEHRHDQSILTNLSIKYKLNSVFLDNKFIKYNQNQPNNYFYE